MFIFQFKLSLPQTQPYNDAITLYKRWKFPVSLILSKKLSGKRTYACFSNNITSEQKSYAVSEEGIVREGDNHFIFRAEQEHIDGELIRSFHPVEVIKGIQDNGWVEVRLLEQPEKDALIAMNNAYYLQAELKKGETEHQH